MKNLDCAEPLVLLAGAVVGHAADDASLPHLRRQGTATQLMVGGKPFLIRGGELGNSTATNAAYLQPFWSKFADLNMNTVLVPVYWDLSEPEEGRLDFSLLDSVIGQARSRRRATTARRPIAYSPLRCPPS